MSTQVSRRKLIAASTLIAAASLAGTAAANPEAGSGGSGALIELLNESLTSKRGVTVVVGSTTIALVVTALDDHYVTGRSQQYERIVVKLGKISAAYM